MKRVTAVLMIAVFFCASVSFGWAQTLASEHDWEDINFVYNSSELVDGFPSMLRMAKLLSTNPEYLIEVRGFADSTGTMDYNKALSKRRADAVASFIRKYGAADNQVQVIGLGEVAEGNETPEGRFQNRHVRITLRDGEGRIVNEGSAPEVITAFESCCEKVISRLNGVAASIDTLKNQPATTKPEDLTRIERKLDAALLAQRQLAPAPLTEQDIERIVKKTIEFNKTPEEVAHAGKRHFPWWEKVIWKGVDFGLNVSANLITNRPIIDRLDKIQNGQIAAFSRLTLGQQDILVGQEVLSQQIATGFESVLSGQESLDLKLGEGIVNLLAGQQDLDQQIDDVQVGIDENGDAIKGIYDELDGLPRCHKETRKNPFGGEYTVTVCE